MKLLACSGAFAVALMVQSVSGQAPTVSHTVPAAVLPGHTLDLTLSGQQLASPTRLWTSFPATVNVLSAAGPASANFRVTVPADVPVGIGGLRVATMQGISELRLIMIDDLASTVESGKNKNRETAQQLELPIAVDGACERELSDYYKFHAEAGQSLTFEVVGRRLGFPIDSVLRLLDSKGNELAYSDDEPATGPDPRLIHRFAADGDYYIELRDVRFEGGPNYRYRLRIGDFPLPVTSFPLALKRGVATSVSFTGAQPSRLTTLTASLPDSEGAAQARLPVSFADGRGSSWVRVLATDQPEQMEQEPNNDPGTSTALAIPGAVEGCLNRAGDRDFYHFEAKKGQRLLFTGQARSLGSPADLFLRIYKADLTVAKEIDDQGGEEGTLDFTCPMDGAYRLMVEHASGGSGADQAYRITAQPYEKGFSLAASAEKFDAPQNGQFGVRVTVNRREYTGPIKLELIGARAGYELFNSSTIPAGKTETRMMVKLPPSFKAGDVDTFTIVGKATQPGTNYEAKVSTLAFLRTRFAGLAYPPAELDGNLAVGVGPEFKPFFAISTPQSSVQVPQPNQTVKIQVKAKKEPGFENSISLAVEGLPKNIKAKTPTIEKGQTEAVVELTTVGPIESLQAIKIVSTAYYKDQPGRSVIEKIELLPAPPLELALAAAGPLKPGGKQKATISLRGNLESLAGKLVLVWKNLPKGVTAPQELALAGGAKQVELELAAAPDAVAGKFDQVRVSTATHVGGRELKIESSPAVIEIVKNE